MNGLIWIIGALLAFAIFLVVQTSENEAESGGGQGPASEHARTEEDTAGTANSAEVGAQPESTSREFSRSGSVARTVLRIAAVVALLGALLSGIGAGSTLPGDAGFAVGLAVIFYGATIAALYLFLASLGDDVERIRTLLEEERSGAR